MSSESEHVIRFEEATKAPQSFGGTATRARPYRELLEKIDDTSAPL